MQTGTLPAALAAVFLIAALAALPAGGRAPQQTPPAAPAVDLTAGRLRVTMGPESGRIRLTVDGVPVVTDSHLYLVKPGWTGVLLNTDSTKPTVTLSEENGAKVATAVFENEDGYARYRFEPRSGADGGGDALTVRVAYGTKKGQPAQVEYAAAYLNANPLSGVPFDADTAEGPRSGAVPAFAASEDQTKSRLTPFLRRVRFDSRLGPLTITAEGSHPQSGVLNLFDARGGTQDWATRHPILWLGLGSPPVAVAEGENTVTVTYAVGPAPARTAAPALSGGGPGAVAAVADARVPFVADRPLIPRPKEVTPGAADAPLRLDRKTRILVPARPSPEEKRAAEELRAELKAFWHLDVPVVTGGGAPRPGDIRLGRGLPAPAAPAQAEGYALTVDAGGATVSGADGRGVYHGAQTLKQLLRVDAKGVYVVPVTIRDWPSLAWRGVHWFGGPRSYPFHKQMIERIVAPLKYNTMVYEVDYTQWSSQPKTWSPTLSTTRDDVKRTVDLARAHLLEPIPLVNAFGHMEWLFGNKQNLDIAADPSRPYAIDPENPRTYQVLLPILDEAISLFRPKTLHIGHDEVSLFGTFPKKGSTKTETELFIRNVNVLHGHLAKQRVRTMLWGDMMLHASEGSGGAAYAASPEESKARRAGVPKDVLIADWHYAGPEYPSTALFKKEGFESVAGTWLDPTNIRGFARTAAKDGASGLLQTTWAGYAMSPEIVRGESFAQFVAYLTAAEHAWNGGANDPADLGYSPDEAFLALWDRQPVARASRGGFTVDLGAAANADLWAWSVAGAPATALPAGDGVRLGGVRYRTGPRAVWLYGALNPAGAWPRAVTLPLGDGKSTGRKASSLEWLIGTTYAATNGARVATVTVTYADGKTAEVPLTYGREAFAFTDTRSGPEATTVWTGRGDAGPVRVRRWTWANPRPGVAITSIALASEGTEAAPVLLGLTGIE